MTESIDMTMESAATPVIHLHGDIVRASADTIDSATAEIIALAPERVVLDFGDTGYIDSSGIALIVGLLGKARSRGIDIEAQGLSAHYRHVFEITRLATYMRIRDETGDSNE